MFSAPRLGSIFHAAQTCFSLVERGPSSTSQFNKWTRQFVTTAKRLADTPSETVPSVTALLSKPIGLYETIAEPTPADLTQAFKPSSFVYHSMTTPMYATIRIHKNSFLVSVGDRVTLPYRLKDVNVGDIIRLTQIETLGSRKFTWKGEPFINDERAVVKARVVEHTKEPMREKIRTKRRNRRVKHIKSKHHYTVLTISEIGVNVPSEGSSN
ncbi:ribosomal protein L21-like protein [Lipomyces arxii]|uniref:mitochondrial 54S ribosomal protein bL21m n=1 Tax=Lipomyces arxii TaxID=56418 RepID=UPI0034CF00FD